MSFRLGSAVIELSTSDAKLDAGLAAAKQKVTAAAGAIQQMADFGASLGRFFSSAAVGAEAGPDDLAPVTTSVARRGIKRAEVVTARLVQDERGWLRLAS